MDKLRGLLAKGDFLRKGGVSDSVPVHVDELRALLADRAELAALREAVNSAPVGWYDSTAQTVFMEKGHERLCASGICDVIVMPLPTHPEASDAE